MNTADVFHVFQDIASQVDHMANFSVSEPVKKAFLAEFMGDASHEWPDETGQTIALLISHENAPRQYLLEMAGIVNRYRLLDIYADVLGIPCKEYFKPVVRTTRPTECGEWLETV